MPSQFPTPDRSPMVQVNITHLIDDVQCYQTVRALRWPDGVTCPSCEFKYVIKRGFDETEPARQRYECHACHRRFDDVTDTIFAGHHQPLTVLVLCLYFSGSPPRPSRGLCYDTHHVRAVAVQRHRWPDAVGASELAQITAILCQNGYNTFWRTYGSNTQRTHIA